mgnify:CR=1 FL=1
MDAARREGRLINDNYALSEARAQSVANYLAELLGLEAGRITVTGKGPDEPIADNGNFVINALEHMSGSSDLISLRNRGEFSRPFEVVNEIRRDAEARFRQQEQMLETRLEETEQKIAELQRERTGNELLLSEEQQAEIEKFRQQQINTRQELRAVQYELQKNVERLGTFLKFINIGLIPLVIAVLAVAIGLIRSRRKTANHHA